MAYIALTRAIPLGSFLRRPYESFENELVGDNSSAMTAVQNDPKLLKYAREFSDSYRGFRNLSNEAIRQALESRGFLEVQLSFLPGTKSHARRRAAERALRRKR